MEVTGSSISGVSVDTTDSEMCQFRSVLSELNHMVVRYCEEVGSPPYWFNERASISLLAAAGWRQGWIALEEYSTRKVLADRQDPKESIDRNGRCDLYLRSPQGSTFAIEAKQIVSKPAELEEAIRDALMRARDDARQLFSNEAACRVALAFVIPTLPATPDGEHGRDYAEWIAQCTTHLQGGRRTNHAYVFPSVAKQFLGPAGKGFWPGMMVIAQRVHRRAASRAAGTPEPQEWDE